jgi:hypothetical protein
MRPIAAILVLSVLHGALAAGVPGEILFAERHPGRDYASHYYANFGYDCGDENYWLHGADGGRLAILNPKTGQVRMLIEDAKGAFRDPCVSYDATKVLFSYRKGGSHHYNLYEINLDGSGLNQLTSGDWDDIEPCYLADGSIAIGLLDIVNQGDREISVTLRELGIDQPCRMCDLWRRKDAGTVADKLTVRVGSRGCAVFRLVAAKTTEP